MTVMRLPLIAGGTVLILLAGALVLDSEPPDSACAATTTAPTAADRHSPIDGYSGDQLVNAADIITAGTHLHVPAAGIVIGVMTAMGESGLRDLDYGDASGPDSRGLFQQRANWGPLAIRLDPTGSATLFFQHLLAIPGWATMAPTLAAHAVQGNAVAGYYTPFWTAAQAVVTALSGSAACADDLTPAPDARAIAEQLVTGIDAGTITGLVPDHLHEIRWIAEGRTVPDCGIDVRILQIIDIAWRLFGRIGLSDINRRCTGQLDGAGIESSHWINGGGHAVDFYSLAGTATDGADSNAIRLIDTLDPLVPAGARIGQAQCRAADDDAPHLTHFVTFDDTCDHLHVDVAYTSGPLLTGTPGATGGSQSGASSSTTGALAASTVALGQGTDLRALANQAAAGPLQLAAGSYPYSDFQADLHGVDLPEGGVTGAGSGSTVLGMTAHTSTHVGDVPTAAGTTNQLYLLYARGGSPTLSGFTLDAAEQGHLYNGLMIGQATGARITDIAVDGVPGNDSSPPGETFAINDWHGVDDTYTHITVDAADVGAAGFGANDSTNLTVTDSTFTGTAYSSGLAIWQSSNVHLDHIQVVGNRSGINFERDTGTITLTAPTFTNNRLYDLQFGTDGPGADVTITDPVLPAGTKIRINCPADYHGVPNGQARDRIHVLVGGVDDTDQLVQWLG